MTLYCCFVYFITKISQLFCGKRENDAKGFLILVFSDKYRLIGRCLLSKIYLIAWKIEELKRFPVKCENDAKGLLILLLFQGWRTLIDASFTHDHPHYFDYKATKFACTMTLACQNFDYSRAGGKW